MIYNEVILRVTKLCLDESRRFSELLRGIQGQSEERQRDVYAERWRIDIHEIVTISKSHFSRLSSVR